MTKHTAAGGCMHPPIFCPVALQTVGIDPFRACMSTCHAQPLVPWGREAEVIQYHGDLQGDEFHPTSSQLFHPTRLIGFFPRKKKKASVCEQTRNVCFC